MFDRRLIRPGPNEKVYRVAKIATVVESLKAKGIAPSQALNGVQLSEAELSSPDVRVSLNQVAECFRNADRLCADPYFAYRTGLRFHVSTYGMYGFAILSSTTFRQACRFAERYHQLETPIANIAFGEKNDYGVWTITPALLAGIDSRLYRFIVELQLGIGVSLHRDVMGPSFTPRELHVTYGASRAERKPEMTFGCPVLFGQPENALVFDGKWLERIPALGNELSHLEAVRLCDHLLREMEVRIGIAGNVRDLLLHNLGRSSTIGAVSKRLKMPVRTLKRRLHELGTSYRQIADELRAEIAIRYLRETDLTIEEVAHCLGYSEAVNFRQAFRRWTRKTPQQFRAGAKGRP